MGLRRPNHNHPTQNPDGFKHKYVFGNPARARAPAGFGNTLKRYMMDKPIFETLNAVNCNEHTEKKNGLTYLSWAWAWAEVKKRFPGANYIIYENPDGWPYWTDGRYCWVKVGVIIEGIEHIEYLPIMDHRNNSIPYERVTTMDVNKAIQRGLTKAAARHGLGLYIYAGEDLPESEAQKPAEEAPAPQPTKTPAKPKKVADKSQEAPKKKVVTDKNIKKIVDWVCEVPEGELRVERMKRAEDSYEWPGDLINAFYTMVELTQ